MSKSLHWAAVVTVVLLIAGGALPSVVSKAPEAAISPYDVRNPITGLAMDGRGQFAAVVVDVDQTDAVLTRDKDDIFVFDLSERSPGIEWRTPHNADNRTSVRSAQAVAFAAGTSDSSLGRFIVGGPGDTLSMWHTNGAAATWKKNADRSGDIVDVALTADARRAAVAVNPPTGTGQLLVYNALDDGKLRWRLPITGAGGENSEITFLAMSRDTGNPVLVVGHARGITVVNPKASDAPSDPFYYRTEGPVTSVDVSRDGNYYVVGTEKAQGGTNSCVYFFGPETTKEEKVTPYASCDRTEAFTDVAISLDGRRFAAGTAEGAIHFFERLPDGSDSAKRFTDPETRASSFEPGSGAIVSLDYDSVGETLVVAAAREALAFHSTRVSHPLWRATADDLRVDAPLAGALVSDNGERVLVAGASRVAILHTSYDARVQVEDGLTRNALPGDRVQYRIRLENTGSAADEYTVRVRAPAGWAFDQPPAVTLLPGENERVTVNLTAPAESDPGEERTRVTVESAALRRKGVDPVVERFQLDVKLERVVDFRIEAEERNVDLNKGDEVAFPFTVRNVGNSEILVNLTEEQRPSAGPAWSIRFESEQLRVQPGGTATGTAYLRAPQDGVDGDVNEITIRGQVGRPASVVRDYTFTVRVNPEFGVSLDADPVDVSATPGTTEFVTLTVTNTGNTPDTVNLTAVVASEVRMDWKVTLDHNTLDLRAGQARDVTLGIRPTGPDAREGTVTVTAVSRSGAEDRAVTVSMSLAQAEKTGFLTPALSLPALVLALVGAAALAGARTREQR